MGKSKKPHWGEELYDEHVRRLRHEHSEEYEYLHEDELYQTEDKWEEVEIIESAEDEEWVEAELLNHETSQHYLDEAHEALARLTQKSNKRGQAQQKRPHRAENWH